MISLKQFLSQEEVGKATIGLYPRWRGVDDTSKSMVIKSYFDFKASHVHQAAYGSLFEREQ